MGSLCNPKRTKTLTAKQRFLQLNIKLEVVANFIFHWWHRTSNKGRQTGSICPPPKYTGLYSMNIPLMGDRIRVILLTSPAYCSAPCWGFASTPHQYFFTRGPLEEDLLLAVVFPMCSKHHPNVHRCIQIQTPNAGKICLENMNSISSSHFLLSGRRSLRR